MLPTETMPSPYKYLLPPSPFPGLGLELRIPWMLASVLSLSYIPTPTTCIIVYYYAILGPIIVLNLIL